MTWVRRLERVFKADIEACEQCGGAVTIAIPSLTAAARMRRRNSSSRPLPVRECVTETM